MVRILRTVYFLGPLAAAGVPNPLVAFSATRITKGQSTIANAIAPKNKIADRPDPLLASRRLISR
jgi:hypothetical protein